MHLNCAINDLCPLLQHLVGENLQVLTTLDESEGAVGISLAQTEQVVFNLVLNARDAMSNGGVITIATKSRE